jgi:hypothetical protein
VKDPLTSTGSVRRLPPPAGGGGSAGEAGRDGGGCVDAVCAGYGVQARVVERREIRKK